jgi:hypothetical protein
MEKEIEAIMETINDWSRVDIEQLATEIDVVLTALDEDERRSAA